jgi:hypothetical protein
MPKNWVAAMTYLERKYPNEFALRTVNRNLNSTDKPIGDQIDKDQASPVGSPYEVLSEGEPGANA